MAVRSGVCNKCVHGRWESELRDVNHLRDCSPEGCFSRMTLGETVGLSVKSKGKFSEGPRVRHERKVCSEKAQSKAGTRGEENPQSKSQPCVVTS